jgi:hypothetical protein
MRPKRPRDQERQHIRTTGVRGERVWVCASQNATLAGYGRHRAKGCEDVSPTIMYNIR